MRSEESQRLENKRINENHPDYRIIIIICQNVEKSRGDLRRFTVVQATEKHYQQTLVRKTFSNSNNNDNSNNP